MGYTQISVQKTNKKEIKNSTKLNKTTLGYHTSGAHFKLKLLLQDRKRGRMGDGEGAGQQRLVGFFGHF